MAQLNVRIDDNIKEKAENACAAMGLTMSSAISIFLTKVANEKRIPFEVSVDPFYSEENIKWIKESIRQLEEGKVVVRSMSDLEAMEDE